LMVPSGVTVLPTNLPPTGSSSVMFSAGSGNGMDDRVSDKPPRAAENGFGRSLDGGTVDL